MSYRTSVRHLSRAGRNPRLWITASSLVLAAASGLPSASLAATFTASDETSLQTAIQNVNASSDPSSTIQLTQDITVTNPAALATLTKIVTLDTGGHNLTGAPFNSGAALTVIGGGQLQMTGVGVGNDALTVTASTLQLTGGGQYSSGALQMGGTSPTLEVSGAGSLLTMNSLSSLGASGTTTIQIDTGGVIRALGGSSSLGGGTGQMNLTIDGAGSELDVSNLTTGGGNTTASVTISHGGTLSATNRLSFGTPVTGGATTLQVTDSGSSLVVGADLDIYRGEVDVLNGAHANAASVLVGKASQSGILLVSGAGSSFTSTGAVTLAPTASSTGILTLANGGVLNAGSIITTVGAGSTSVINIGGAETAPAAAAGTLNAPTIAFGQGTNRLNFNHTDTNYQFGAAITGAGTINQVAGQTHLTGNSSGFTGATSVTGGALFVDGTLGGTTTVDGAGIGLGGDGSLGGNVTVQNGALVSPSQGGGAAESLAIGGDLTVTGATVQVENGDTLTAGLLTADQASTVEVSGAGSQLTVSQIKASSTAGTTAIQVDNGGKINTTGETRLSGGSTLTVDGAGSVVTTGSFIGADTGTVTVNITNGGVLHALGAASISSASAPGTTFNLNVTNAGSRFAVDSAFGFTSGVGNVDVSDGGVMAIQNGFNIGTPSGTSQHSVQITDPGSTLTVGGNLGLFRGTLDVLNGAHASAGSLALSVSVNEAATATVAGGASFDVTGAVAVSSGNVNNTTATLILNTGGEMTAGGVVTVGGAAATRNGELVIGDVGVIRAAGDLNAAGLVLTAGTGTLTFNHNSAGYEFATPISGGGVINHTSGETHLTGDSSGFTGTTNITDGELDVDGKLGGASSVIALPNGATLGGTGTIGGDVNVGGGGILAPGGTTTAGTLTIGGDLSLSPTSILKVDFGQSNVVGGPLNDLVKVGGNLTLGGTVNVAVTSGGVFDAGLYRIASYGGALTGSGLAVGTTPVGSTVTVQTAIPGQVNLVNTGGLTVNFWDGDGAGSANNGVLDGGAGTWTSASTNWTTETGAVNLVLASGAFPIFAGTPGTVNVSGPVTVGGMQFAVDGYHLTGAGPITLNAAGNHTIRVGDGTADGASYVAIIDTPIIGNNGLIKTDLGTLVLNGANAYGFTTNIKAGTLIMNGSEAGGGSAVIVSVGATLGGNGSLPGGVSSGTIAPGGLTSPGTLTFRSNLVLQPTATLRYRLGQAGTVGGALNDLLVVNGNLTLNGTLNVTQSAGGNFGAGVYRLINYTGTLTDNVLDVGSLPTSFTGTVQTSIANQVNLVVLAPPPPPPSGGGGGTGPGGGNPPPPPPPPPASSPFNFWDSGDGAANGTVSGGDGTWRASTGNWTTAAGDQDAAFTAGGFAIFAATPGTVSVDDSQGAIHVGGIQFAADGYRLVGDAVTLDAGADTVRVGDGTTAGAAFTATVGAALTGAGQLNKTDGGTLVLSGANTYSGGTVISGGTLALGDGGTTGSIVGDVADDGVLAFNRSDAVTFGGVISGGGGVLQIGSGSTTLTADSSAFTGLTQVQKGVLAVDGALGGTVEVQAGGTLTGTGLVGALHNAGLVSPGHSIGTLTVAGDYVGQGGVLQMEAELGGDASAADRLVVHGATSGSTLVNVQRVGGTGAATTNGILLVQVDGASNGVFTLAKGDYRLGGENALVAGAYAYVLRKDTDGGDWKLRSTVTDPPGAPSLAGAGQPGTPGEPVSNGGAGSPPPVTLYQPGAPVYEAYPQALQALNGVGTMRQRIGARQWSGDEGDGIWGRIDGGHTHLEPTVTTAQANLNIDRWNMQFGIDRPLSETFAGGRLVGGVTAHYGEANTNVASPFGGGGIDTKGYGIGATATWTTAAGAYVDAQAQGSWFDSNLSSNVLGERAKGADGHGYAVSIEAGKAVAASSAFTLTPQAQLTYSKVGFDSFTDSFGANVSSDRGGSLLGRLGLALDHGWAAKEAGGAGHVYGLVNLSHEFLDGVRVDVSGAQLDSRTERTWGGLATGGTYSWGDGRYTVYGEASADTQLSGFGDSYSVGGTAGFRMRF